MVAADAVIAVYMMASRRNGTIYTGVTSALVTRVWQHKTGVTKGFAEEYGCKTLVWYEQHGSMIEARNESWNDLARHWYD